MQSRNDGSVMGAVFTFNERTGRTSHLTLNGVCFLTPFFPPH